MFLFISFRLNKFFIMYYGLGGFIVLVIVYLLSYIFGGKESVCGFVVMCSRHFCPKCGFFIGFENDLVNLLFSTVSSQRGHTKRIEWPIVFVSVLSPPGEGRERVASILHYLKENDQRYGWIDSCCGLHCHFALRLELFQRRCELNRIWINYSLHHIGLILRSNEHNGNQIVNRFSLR